MRKTYTVNTAIAEEMYMGLNVPDFRSSSHHGMPPMQMMRTLTTTVLQTGCCAF